MNYRDKLGCEYDYAELRDDDYNFEENKIFLEKDDVLSTINDIESEVNAVLEKLEPIEGLSEIEEVRDMVKDLSSKLY